MLQIENTQNLEKEVQIRKELSKLKTIPYILKKITDTQIIYGFGSWFKGEENKSSDIDFALLAKSQLAPIDRWDLQNGLADQLRRNVDVVTLLTASSIYE